MASAAQRQVVPESIITAALSGTKLAAHWPMPRLATRLTDIRDAKVGFFTVRNPSTATDIDKQEPVSAAVDVSPDCLPGDTRLVVWIVY